MMKGMAEEIRKFQENSTKSNGLLYDLLEDPRTRELNIVLPKNHSGHIAFRAQVLGNVTIDGQQIREISISCASGVIETAPFSINNDILDDAIKIFEDKTDLLNYLEKVVGGKK